MCLTWRKEPSNLSWMALHVVVKCKLCPTEYRGLVAMEILSSGSQWNVNMQNIVGVRPALRFQNNYNLMVDLILQGRVFPVSDFPLTPQSHRRLICQTYCRPANVVSSAATGSMVRSKLRVPWGSLRGCSTCLLCGGSVW